MVGRDNTYTYTYKVRIIRILSLCGGICGVNHARLPIALSPMCNMVAPQTRSNAISAHNASRLPWNHASTRYAPRHLELGVPFKEGCGRVWLLEVSTRHPICIIIRRWMILRAPATQATTPEIVYHKLLISSPRAARNEHPGARPGIYLVTWTRYPIDSGCCLRALLRIKPIRSWCMG
jgi:hypothetical protein